MMLTNAIRRLLLISIAFSHSAFARAQEFTTFNAPFVVHKLAHASQSRLLLISHHQLATLRFDPSQSPQTAAIDQQLSVSDKSQILIADAATIDSQFLVAGSETNNSGITETGAIALLDAQGHLVWRTELKSPIVTLAIASPFVIVGDTLGTLTAIAIEDGRVKWENQTHGKMVTALSILNDEFGVSGDWSGKLVMWSRADGREVVSFQQHRDRITSLQSIAPAQATDPSKLISASRDGTLRLWHPTQRRLVRFAQLNHPIVTFTQLADLKFLVATNDGNLQIVDLNNASTRPPFLSPETFTAALAQFDQQVILTSSENNQLQILPISDLLRSSE